MKIISWNINSIRIRFPILQACVDAMQPDILCLQETKVTDELFPIEDVRTLGFEHMLYRGQKSYNGVAILSKVPLKLHEKYDFLGNNEARHISAELPDGTIIHNNYVPAGGDEPDPTINPKFKDKLATMDALIAWSSSLTKSDKAIILGDMNIAPGEHDVWSHKQLLKIVSHTPIEIEKMQQLQASADWIDTARLFTPEDEKLYSWWSYRNRDWRKSNRGRRLDHIWATPALKDRIIGSQTLFDARDWEKPSDHVPVMLELSA